MNLQAYFHESYVPLADANISIATHAFNYGTGCFEGIRGYWNADQEQLYVLKLPEHMGRLLRSSKVLKIDLGMNEGQLCEAILEMLRANRFRSDAYIRPIAYKSGRQIKVALGSIAS